MTEHPKDGGPAFPITAGNSVYAQGMSLRDWFAGQALAGMAGTTTRAMYDEGYSVAEVKAALVRQAYGIADAMISAREVRHD